MLVIRLFYSSYCRGVKWYLIVVLMRISQRTNVVELSLVLDTTGFYRQTSRREIHCKNRGHCIQSCEGVNLPWKHGKPFVYITVIQHYESSFNRELRGTSPVHRLGLHTSTAGDLGSIPVRELRTLQAAWLKKKKKTQIISSDVKFEFQPMHIVTE